VAEEDEERLLERARAGDRAAFSALAARHRDSILRAAWAVLGNEADALDATQEALLRAYRHLGGFDARASFATWTRRIATNCALDRLERRTRDRAGELPGDDLASVTQESATDELARDEERAIVRRAIEELPPAQRSAVLLRDVEGLSYEEIAAALSIPKGTVMSRIYYGRETLKEKLARLLPGERSSPAPASGAARSRS
jgi:RNA polymerase sigma-70 factor (ECF subfamily)